MIAEMTVIAPSPQLRPPPPPAEIADAIGFTRREKRARNGGRSCAECFFHRNLLCALDLDQPCSTFRPDTPQGLVPPRQPSLLVRRALGETH
jgi:hypothetical protein